MIKLEVGQTLLATASAYISTKLWSQNTWIGTSSPVQFSDVPVIMTFPQHVSEIPKLPEGLGYLGVVPALTAVAQEQP